MKHVRVELLLWLGIGRVYEGLDWEIQIWFTDTAITFAISCYIPASRLLRRPPSSSDQCPKSNHGRTLFQEVRLVKPVRALLEP